MNFPSIKLPFFESLKNYSSKIFQRDLVAGLTVGVMLIPQAMAYAYLAGVPPIYGLYASTIPIILYSLLGSSRRMATGPVAISSLLVLAGVSELATPGTARYIELVITCGFMIGIMQCLLGAFRMGFMVNFLSQPVVAGFTSAAAIIILFSQMGAVLGINIPASDNLLETCWSTLKGVPVANLVTVGISVLSIIVILCLKKWDRRIPGPLLVLVAGILLSYFFNWQEMGVAIIGDIPKGLPHFQLPHLDILSIQALLPTALTVTIIGVVESYGIAKVLESKHRSNTLQPNQEMLALGIAKMVGSFFQAVPTSASFSRSAVNDQAGAKTQVAGLISAVLVILTLLFFTALFFYLPKAILAAIILVSVFGLFDVKEAKFLWKTHRRDFTFMMVTFFLTLALGIEKGVAIGVTLSLLNVVWKSAYPHLAVLGKMPNKTYYRNIERFAEAETEPGLLIVRVDDQLFFGNASFFKTEIKDLVEEDYGNVKALFIDMKGVKSIDSTAIHMMEDLYRWCDRQEIIVYICSAIGPVRDIFEKSGLQDRLGRNHHFLFVNEAVVYHKSMALNEVYQTSE